MILLLYYTTLCHSRKGPTAGQQHLLFYADVVMSCPSTQGIDVPPRAARAENHTLARERPAFPRGEGAARSEVDEERRYLANRQAGSIQT